MRRASPRSCEHICFERERAALAAVLEHFIKELEAGHNIVLDHGLWCRADRDTWTRAARAVVTRPALVYLPTSGTKLLERLETRNRRDEANVTSTLSAAFSWQWRASWRKPFHSTRRTSQSYRSQYPAVEVVSTVFPGRGAWIMVLLPA
ncbi:AAA family ATPase [Streptomyces sp. NBC_00826]